MLWTPIYRIPQGRDKNELRTSFVTLHSLRAPADPAPHRPLAPPFTPHALALVQQRRAEGDREGGAACMLPAFGLIPSRIMGIWKVRRALFFIFSMSTCDQLSFSR